MHFLHVLGRQAAGILLIHRSRAAACRIVPAAHRFGLWRHLRMAYLAAMGDAQRRRPHKAPQGHY